MGFKIVYAIAMGVAAGLLISASPNSALGHNPHDPAHTVQHIVDKANSSSDRMDEIADDFLEAIDEVDDEDQAASLYSTTIKRVDQRLVTALDNIDGWLTWHPQNAEVIAAHEAASLQLQDAHTAAHEVADDAYQQYLATVSSTTSTTVVTTLPPTTTSLPVPTTPPPTTTPFVTSTTTTTTVPPTTTSSTTTSSTTTTTTTTTTVAAATSPPSGPGQSLQAAPRPIPEVLGETFDELPTRPAEPVSFVRRLVDNRLPPGVSQVAASPFIVIELVLNAILAAGALMVLPWIALMTYGIYLIRDTRVRALTLAVPSSGSPGAKSRT